jgi:hypothetical protein
MKLPALSKASWNVVLAVSPGFIANVLLEGAWLTVWSLLSIAAAWSSSTLMFNMVIVFLFACPVSFSDVGGFLVSPQLGW